ncbi:acetyltransferase [Sulfitobacter sp. SK012]|uniref:CatB-related O-acetyltransferase n=1 Tax=Sulfitobacter sp. SK012 TaxID=1389005 RepID=UPI000E0A31BD|nr:CatB-related O-acetyltransferase [Sulfitobacter sp. SK012]AXI45094.1 acetyltransferase [Sulfitobacter sp. SK012]
MSDKLNFPSPETRHPISLPDGKVHEGTVFLAAVVVHPRIEVGEYTYASAFDAPTDWAARLAPYLFDFSPERLIIGKFCQIADGVRFITSSANHRYDGISSFPFAIFDGARDGRPSMPDAGPDTVIGNDVWIGQAAVILPGTHIGDGVIVGAGAVVSGQIAPYTIVAGNPTRTIRSRFANSDVQKLVEIAWWDWSIEQIIASEAEISGGDVDALADIAAGN